MCGGGELVFSFDTTRASVARAQLKKDEKTIIATSKTSLKRNHVRVARGRKCAPQSRDCYVAVERVLGGWCRTKPVLEINDVAVARSQMRAMVARLFETNGVAVACVRKCAPQLRDCCMVLSVGERLPKPSLTIPPNACSGSTMGGTKHKGAFRIRRHARNATASPRAKRTRWCRCGLCNASCHAQLSQGMQAKPSGESIMSSARVWAHPPSPDSLVKPAPTHSFRDWTLPLVS